MEKSIREGGILHIHYKPGSFLWNELINLHVVDTEKKLMDFTSDELNLLLFSEPFKIQGSKEKLSYNRTFEGLARKLERSMAEKGEDEASEEDKNAYLRFFKYETCAECNGSRINEAARNVKIKGVSIDEVCRWELPEVLDFLKGIDDEMAIPITRKAIFVLE
jgi:excinuclease UvrABC ATPase subunit